MSTEKAERRVGEGAVVVMPIGPGYEAMALASIDIAARDLTGKSREDVCFLLPMNDSADYQVVCQGLINTPGINRLILAGPATKMEQEATFNRIGLTAVVVPEQLGDRCKRKIGNLGMAARWLDKDFQTNVGNKPGHVVMMDAESRFKPGISKLINQIKPGSVVGAKMMNTVFNGVIPDYRIPMSLKHEWLNITQPYMGWLVGGGIGMPLELFIEAFCETDEILPGLRADDTFVEMVARQRGIPVELANISVTNLTYSVLDEENWRRQIARWVSSAKAVRRYFDTRPNFLPKHIRWGGLAVAVINMLAKASYFSERQSYIPAVVKAILTYKEVQRWERTLPADDVHNTKANECW